jgi:hypothetical protein
VALIDSVGISGLMAEVAKPPLQRNFHYPDRPPQASVFEVLDGKTSERTLAR